MVSVGEINWLAGLLEGEGCFTTANVKQADKPYKVVHIQLCMTDQDIVSRAAVMLGAPVLGPYSDKRPNCKPTYRCTIGGTKAAHGQRRRQKIEEPIAIWKLQRSQKQPREGCRESTTS